VGSASLQNCRIHFVIHSVYLQACGRADVYNFWADAKSAADLIYNPAHFAGAYN